MGGGDFGRLVPLEGVKSLWCGTRPGTNEYLCGWASAPGYGNDWHQIWQSEHFTINGKLTFQYKGMFDSEDGYDKTFVEYDSGINGWVQLAVYDGVVETAATHELYLAQSRTKFRFRFTSDGAWSDQDGLWNSDGACILDEITITDAYGVVDYEDFEYAMIGDKRVGMWYADVEEPYGCHAELAYNLQDKDPCNGNNGTQVMFFANSAYPSSEYPGQYDTPFCQESDGILALCQNEAIVSPIIDMTRYSSTPDEVQDQAFPPEILATLRGSILRFTVYRDLPLSNLVFYTWEVRNWIFDCPTAWKGPKSLYYGEDRDYLCEEFDISDLVTSGWKGDPLQIRIGVVDMCGAWFGVYGDCAAHTPAPYFDNIRLYRYETTGPHWSYRDIDLFQDNFPSSGLNIESTSRADIANDLLPPTVPGILPGDAALVSCYDPEKWGLDTLVSGPYTGYAFVYCYVKCTYIGPNPAKPVIEGPVMEGDWGHYLSHVTGGWTTFLCDSALTSTGEWIENAYCIDLNDDLFTRGYRIDYYFKARNLLGEYSTLPPKADEGVYFEFTILPTLASGVLFVDDFSGRGSFRGTVETYMMDALTVVLDHIEVPDIYDVNGPSSLVSNGPGSRAHQSSLDSAYTTIIWDSGNLNRGTITEGTAHSDKSNDAQMLETWLRGSNHKTGLWVMGDDVADDLSQPAAAPIALALMSTTCGVKLVHDSYYELTGGFTAGGVISPLVQYFANPALLFTDPIGPISYCAFGGCPTINGVDVIETTYQGINCLEYPDYPTGTRHIAGIYTSQTNDGGFDMKTVWMGHSFMYIRDISPCSSDGPIVRYRIVNEVLDFFLHDVDVDITRSDELPRVFALALCANNG